MEKHCLNQRLLNEGVRLNDVLRLTPLYGHRRKITLNRSKVTIHGTLEGRFEGGGDFWEIPMLKNENLNFELLLVGKSKQSLDERGRYFLRSKNGIPFKHNQIFCLESYVERGDIVDLGMNRIEFLKEADEGQAPISEILLNKRFLESDMSLLIEGETGTGKSHLAKEIHDASGRAGQFVQINISSFSSGLVESELFGHSKGAFTGASFEKLGAIREANYGTLFVDEIDSLPLETQLKLLLFLDSKAVRPVGAAQSYKVDVRLIFASGQNLKDLVLRKLMRQDFYFRIASGFTEKLIPLRRNERLMRLICNEFMNKHGVYITKDLMEFFKGYSWPGNVRQLLGHLDKKVLMSKSNKLEFDTLDKALKFHQLCSKTSLHNELLTMKTLKAEYAQYVYQKCDYQIAKSAELLDITKNTMRTLIQATGKESCSLAIKIRV